MPDEVAGIEARALATVDGLAILLNTLIVVYCASLFMVVRRALWTVAGEALALQLAGYIADTVRRQQRPRAPRVHRC